MAGALDGFSQHRKRAFLLVMLSTHFLLFVLRISAMDLIGASRPNLRLLDCFPLGLGPFSSLLAAVRRPMLELNLVMLHALNPIHSTFSLSGPGVRKLNTA
jgi:hypothetical protein